MDKVLFICLGDPLVDFKGDMRIVRDRSSLLKDYFDIDCISIRPSLLTNLIEVYPSDNSGFRKITYISLGIPLLFFSFFKLLATKPKLLFITPLQLLFSTLTAPILRKKYSTTTHYKLIHVFHIRSLGFLPQLPEVPLFIDLIDSYTLNISRSLSAYKAIYQPFIRRELRLITTIESDIPLPHQNALVSTVSHVDRLYLSSQRIPRESFKVFPQLVHPSEPPFSSLNIHKPALSLIFFGNLDYLPNEQAITYLCDFIESYSDSLPKSFSLTVAGRNLSPRLVKRLNNSNVLVISPVKDMQALVCKHSCSIAPMFHGSGIQSKILESMSWGVPVITTPLCIDALYQGESSGALSFKSFVELNRLLKQLELDSSILSQLSRTSLNYIQANYSPQALGPRLLSAYRTLMR